MAINPVEIIIRAKDQASSVFSSVGAKVSAVGAAIAAYFGINAFVGAVKGAAELEAKLSEVQAVSGATTAEMLLLRKAAEDAGATTKFSATEGAEALANLARSGLSAKDAVAALPPVLLLAQAGGVGLGEASDYVTKIVMGMGLAFTDAGRVADVLAKGANASNTSVTGLAQALSYSAPLAKSLGLSLETTVAIIGKFADAGIDASRAGTALNAIMAQFSDPASKFKTALAAAGITTVDFEQALRQLAAAGPKGSEAINAVGTEAGPALRSLLNQGIGALDDLKGKLDNAAGSASATAKVMENNLQGSFNSLASAWDTVKNALATPVLPVLKEGVEKLSAAFSDAVSSGVVAKFGESIAIAFASGIKWAQNFVASIDFTKVAADLRAFADRSGEVFTQIGQYASAAGNSARLAYGVMSAGTNTVLGAVYLLGEAFAGVASNIQSGLALIMRGYAKITFGNLSASFKQAADDIKLSADATWAASQALGTQATAAFVRVADAAQLARDGYAGLATSSTDASAKATPAAGAFDQVATSLAKVGSAADDAAAKVQSSADKQKAASEDLRKKAEADAKAIAEAFARAGIQTTEALVTAASTAQKDFELIKKSGQASAEGLQTAFKKYADAAIAANGGIVSGALKTEAAMAKVSFQTDSTGKVVTKAMTGAKSAVDGLSAATGDYLDKQKLVNDLNQASAKAIDTVDNASKGLTDTLSAETQAKVDNAKAGVDEAQAAYESAKASGDELGAAEALVKVKEAELEYAKVLAQAKREEAKAARETADAKAAEARAAAEAASAIAAEIANAETVTAAMKAQAAEARVNAIAKAGAAKEAYAHADALDAEAKGAERAVAAAERAVATSKKSLDDVRKATDEAANSARNAAAATQGVAAGGNAIAKAFDPMEAINQKVATLAKELGTAGNTADELKWATSLASEGVARLGEQNLQTLRAAIDSATQKMQTMSDAAKTALTSVQDELDQLNANYDDIERRKYEAKLKELQTLLDQAVFEKNQTAATDLREAIAKTKQLYEGFKIPDAIAKNKTEGNLSDTALASTGAERDAAQARAQRQRNIDTSKAAADSAAANQQTTPPGAADTDRRAGTSNTYTVNIPNYGTVNVASDSDASSLTRIIDQLARAKATAGV